MKLSKYVSLILMTFALFFISCEEDSEDNEMVVTQEALVGTWSLTSFEADVLLSTTIQDQDLNSSIKNVGDNFNYTLTFTDSSYTSEGNYDVTVSGTVAGNEIESQNITLSDVSATGGYELDGNMITFENELFNVEAAGMNVDNLDVDTITTVSTISFNANGNLILVEEGAFSGDQDGIKTTYSTNSRAVLEKVE